MSNVILGSDGIAIRQGIYEAKADKKTDLGRFIDFEDGRRFRYCKCNASAGIAHAKMAAASLVVADDNAVTQTDMTVVLSNGYIGEKVINVLLGDDTTANLYEDGLLTIEDSTGQGYSYRIRKNKAGGAPYTDPCELTLYDPLVVALDANSVITLTMNKRKNVIINPSGTQASVAVGVPLVDVTEAYYFWAQTRGYAALIIGTATTIGYLVGPGAADGACDAAGGTTQKPWGTCVQIASTGNYITVDLNLE